MKENKKERKWTLRKLDAADNAAANMSTAEQAQHEADYESFLEELDGDREMRSKLNLYKRTDSKARRGGDGAGDGAADGGMDVDGGSAAPSKGGGGLDEDEVRLDELLDDLALVEGRDEVPELDEEPYVEKAASPLQGTVFDAGKFDPAQMKFV